VKRASAVRYLAVIPVLLLMGLAAAGCGGSDNGATREQLDRAREEGAKEARDQAKVDRLQRQVNQLRREQKNSTGGNSGNGSSSSSRVPAVNPAKTCGDGIGASSATSCDFAFNVAGEYGSNPGASSIRAYSPVTGSYYAMTCVPMNGWSAVCTGGNGAAVFIP